MQWIKTLWSELFGLFVDDGYLAVAIIVWIVAAAVLLRQVDASGASKGCVLFIGLAIVLAESVLRRARR
jgi:hypothetical protein